jgi:hypothetical protein
MKLGKLEIAVIIIAALVLASGGAFLIFATRTAPVTAAPVTTTSLEGDTGFSISSPKILIGNVPLGGQVDDLTLNLHNGTSDNITVFVAYHRPDRVTVDADTMINYQPAPKNAQNWITISRLREITIPPASIMSIPVSIAIPKDAECPERWEFDLKVTEAGNGFITTAYLQRYLITMR